ncbi:MAG: hypothetical protein J7J96_08275 [Sulfurimonas sp.]|nr:hypothetical protein [Sulfurimonas sp.]
MHIKRYTIASFILIALMGWVGTFSDQSVTINVFGVVLPPLSIAFLVMIPMFFLYIASVAHIAFYSIIGSFKLRKYEKDYEKIIDSIVDALLGKENRNYIFKTPRYKMLGSLVDNTTIFPNTLDSASIEDEKIRKTVKIIEDIKNTKIVDMKKLSLPIDNSLVIQNERNRYKSGDVKAEDFLGYPDKYNKQLLTEIYVDFVKTASLTAIESYKTFMNKEALFNILSRVNSDENTLVISVESLIELFKMLELDTKDYLDISILLSSGMIPEQRIKLFETISDEKDEAMDAYLFTLFDLEMIAPADTILEISQPDEYLNFKAYQALREHHENFNINLFI